MSNRENFFKQVAAFFDSGVIREIYGNERISLINVANSLYVGTNYYRGKGNGNYLGLILGVDQLRNTITNNNYISEFISHASKKTLKQVIIEFNDSTLATMKSIKERTDNEGPTEYIDFEFEKEISKLK